MAKFNLSLKKWFDKDKTNCYCYPKSFRLKIAEQVWRYSKFSLIGNRSHVHTQTNMDVSQQQILGVNQAWFLQKLFKTLVDTH